MPLWELKSPKLSGCEPLKIGLLAESESGGSQPHKTRWTSTSSSMDTLTNNSDSLSYTFLSDGLYTVKGSVEFKNGCKDAETVDVTVYPVPNAQFDWGPKNTTILEPFIQFNNLSTDADYYEWDLGRVADKKTPIPASSVEENPFVTYPNPDSSSYFITLIARNNVCVDSLKKRIWILDNFSVYVPNAFTPDGDASNDVFYPKGKNHDNVEGSSEYEFMIFNRWGQMVWNSTTPYEPWDGTESSTNNNVPQDVYVWKLAVWDNIESTLKIHYGRVSLLR